MLEKSSYGVVDQQVGLAELREEVAVLQARRRDGRPGVLLELRPVQPVQLPQGGEVDQAVDGVHVPGLELELVDQEVAQRVGGVRVDLEADRVLRPAAFAQQGLDGAAEVEHLVLAELRVLVPRDPEQRRVLDVHPREQRVEVRLDDAFDRDPPPAVGQRMEPRQQRRDLDPGEPLLAALGVANHHGDVERQVRDVGERVRRVDRERREHREDLVEEHLAERLAILVGELVPAAHRDALLRERRANPFAPLGPGAATSSRARSRISPSCSGGVRPSGESSRMPASACSSSSADADLEELVEVRREDREELRPFEEPEALVLGEREDAGVEVQPRQVAVQHAGGRVERRVLGRGVHPIRVAGPDAPVHAQFCNGA